MERDIMGNPRTVHNPKALEAASRKKRNITAVPMPVLYEVGAAMEEGAAKYGRHNFRSVGTIKASTYVDSAFGHLADWWEGEDIDVDSGLSHVTKAIASLFVLRDSMLHGTFEDDRPAVNLKGGCRNKRPDPRIGTEQCPGCDGRMGPSFGDGDPEGFSEFEKEFAGAVPEPSGFCGVPYEVSGPLAEKWTASEVGMMLGRPSSQPLNFNVIGPIEAGGGYTALLDKQEATMEEGWDAANGKEG